MPDEHESYVLDYRYDNRPEAPPTFRERASGLAVVTLRILIAVVAIIGIYLALATKSGTH